ncbi:hypothetical protein D3C72_625430 [compost metagenome]
MPNGVKGFTSTVRSSMYSMPRCSSASEGFSPLRGVRLGRIGAYSSFSSCSTLSLSWRYSPFTLTPILANSGSWVLMARRRLLT